LAQTAPFKALLLDGDKLYPAQALNEIETALAVC